MHIERITLSGLQSVEAVVTLLRQLGYQAAPHPIDTQGLELDSYPKNAILRAGERRREGYAVLVAEVPELPRSLASFGKRLLLNLHDHPLALLGVPGPSGAWARLVVLRPRRVRTRTSDGTAYRVAKLDMLTSAPTRYDTQVFERLRWDPAAPDPQAKVDEAFNVEAVTRDFFRGLRQHSDAIRTAIENLGSRDIAARNGIELARGSDRVTIRLMSQMLFCWFLQRKRLLANDPEYLLSLWRGRQGAYYASQLEPLFYATLNTPVTERRLGRPGPEVPFLNGGLFECAYGDVSLDLPDHLFDPTEGLLGYLSRWTFTISEEAPDEVDVAIDPELLGRVFEHLISDEEQARLGVVYTPRPVVQFMVREALVAWIVERLSLPEDEARRVMTEESPFKDYSDRRGTSEAAHLCRRLDEALDALTIIDPAVGSGAFLLGSLVEIVRLRTLLHEALHNQHPDLSRIRAWKLAAIQRTLFGVDLEPVAIELCRLRLWLSLLADAPDGGAVEPLPNLDHRTVAADALTDFVGAIPVQNTRGLRQESSEEPLDVTRLERLRDRFFCTYEPAGKDELRREIAEEENSLVYAVLSRAEENARSLPDDKRADAETYLRGTRGLYSSKDRVFPIFMPRFHAPDVAPYGGWDIVIMNPPYLGKKQVAHKVPPRRRLDYSLHHAETNDLMVLFGYRASQLVRTGGVVSMIFNDSVFTSTDSTDLRARIVDRDELLAVARTRCFEGVAVNGGVVVWRRQPSPAGSVVRWVENYRRDTRELAGANDPAEEALSTSGETEVFAVPADVYRKVPGRPLFRPSPAALQLLPFFEAMIPAEIGGRPAEQRKWWLDLAQQPNVSSEHVRRLDGLAPGTVVPLGHCVRGGVGLQTGDDRFFLAAIQGTVAAEDCLNKRRLLIAAIVGDAVAAPIWRGLLEGYRDEEAALVELHEKHEADLQDRKLPWPRLLRVAPRALVRTTPIGEGERLSGISQGPHFLPFEKGDRSGTDDEGRTMAAAWCRENPIVIDWSTPAVAMLRKRAKGLPSHRKPYLRNEGLWGQGGVTWNETASYLRARLMPSGGIFGHMAALMQPVVSWLDSHAFLALLNSDTADFMIRTFLGSRMHIDVGDIRRIPLPVLTPEQASTLSRLGKSAVEAATVREEGSLRHIEREVDLTVRRLYGISEGEQLWVAR